MAGNYFRSDFKQKRKLEDWPVVGCQTHCKKNKVIISYANVLIKGKPTLSSVVGVGSERQVAGVDEESSERLIRVGLFWELLG